MSNQMAVLNPAQVPAAFHSLMQQMQASELSQNVGANYAVISIKGKVFRIKHGGVETPLTINLQGQEYAAPYMDVVIPLANPQLSKTYYASGYAEGSDEAPTCWSEDGRNPLAPLENRPKIPETGQPCHDCLLCPANVFGSKINEVTGAKGKACADTRKLVVIPLDVNGGVDAENARFGGPMLLRVPAASLQPFAEYDRKLQSMGVPYFAVVTRMQFDSTVAYPKFQLSPLRLVTEAEAQEILKLRGGQQVQAILAGGHSSAPALAAPVPTPVEHVAPVTQAMHDAAPATMGFPAPTATPMPAAAPATAAPVPVAPAPVPPPAPATPAQPAPTHVPVAPPPAPPAVAPAAAPAAPAPVAAFPTAPAPAPAAAAPPAAFPGFPAPAAAPPQIPGQMAPQIAMPPQAAPAAEQAPATVSPELLGRIDQLLDS